MEGQIRGVARMVERDEYCIDILQQTAALRAGVDAVSLLLMEDHVAGCLATAVKTGDAAAYTEEVMEVVRRSMGRPVRARHDRLTPTTTGDAYRASFVHNEAPNQAPFLHKSGTPPAIRGKAG